jgi:hypothetical protein
MGLFVRALVSLLVIVMVVVPVGQLMFSSSVTSMHQRSAKTARASSSARVPAVTGSPALDYHVILAVGRVDLLDPAAPLPGFTLDLFVPPRA